MAILIWITGLLVLGFLLAICWLLGRVFRGIRGSYEP
jgi:hypothetical protein